DVRLTFLSLAVVPILLASIKFFGRAMRARGLVAPQAESKVYALIHQGVAAMPLIQSYTREQHEQRSFNAQTEQARRHKLFQHGLEVFYWLLLSTVFVVCTD